MTIYLNLKCITVVCRRNGKDLITYHFGLRNHEITDAKKNNNKQT